MRLATVAIRISDPKECDDVVKSYQDKLGYAPNRPLSQEGASKAYYSFPTSVHGGPGQARELLIIRQSQPDTDCTINYYQVTGTTEDELKTAHDKLLKHGHGQRESPRRDPDYPISTGKPLTYRSLLQKNDGLASELVGLTINPPWPRGRQFLQPQQGFAKYLLLAAGVVAGLLLAPLLSRRTGRRSYARGREASTTRRPRPRL